MSRCMRTHGVPNFPDPQFQTGAGGVGIRIERPRGQPELAGVPGRPEGVRPDLRRRPGARQGCRASRRFAPTLDTARRPRRLACSWRAVARRGCAAESTTRPGPPARPRARFSDASAASISRSSRSCSRGVAPAWLGALAACGAAARLRPWPACAAPACRSRALLAHAHVLGPAADVAVQRRVLDRDRALADRVEQRAIVGDEQQRAAELVQRLLERLAALEVEVVGRLVEDQDVGAGLDEDRQRQPPALASGEHLERLLGVLAGEQEPARAAPRALFGVSLVRWVVASSTVRAVPAESSSACWERNPSLTLWPVRSLPSTTGPRTRASSISRRPASVSISVVLPAPLGPTSDTCSPRSSHSSTSSSSSAISDRHPAVLELEHHPAAALGRLERELEPGPVSRAPVSGGPSWPASWPATAPAAPGCPARNRVTNRSSRSISACWRSIARPSASSLSRLLAAPGVPRAL